ncbi:MAG: MBL fold metallo-hydrolase [Fibrobacterota bacterium]
MKIICWGVRGSLPSSGKDFALYGGDTTCIEVLSNEGERVIIDAGSGIRRLANNISSDENRVIHLLLTHYHLDHIIGTPFVPQLFNSSYTFNIFGPAVEAAGNVRTPFSTTISPPYFPLGLENKAIKADLHFHTINETTFEIGSLRITTIRLSHTNHGGLGYRIEEGGRSFVFLTDNELGFLHAHSRTLDEYTAFAADADLLLHDAQFTAEEYENHVGWGHSSIDDVVQFAQKCGAKKTGFIHYSIDRTDADIEELYGSIARRSGGKMIPIRQTQRFTV